MKGLQVLLLKIYVRDLDPDPLAQSLYVRASDPRYNSSVNQILQKFEKQI